MSTAKSKADRDGLGSVMDSTMMHTVSMKSMTSLEGSTKSTRTNTMSAQSTTSLVSIGDSAMVDTTSMRSIAVWWARWTGEHHEEPYD